MRLLYSPAVNVGSENSTLTLISLARCPLVTLARAWAERDSAVWQGERLASSDLQAVSAAALRRIKADIGTGDEALHRVPWREFRKPEARSDLQSLCDRRPVVRLDLPPQALADHGSGVRCDIG